MNISEVAEAEDPAVADAGTRLALFRNRLRGPIGVERSGRWECDRRGAVVWSEGEGCLPLGSPIGDFADGSPLASAFARRRPFRRIDGAGGKISGVPFFSPLGAFIGYRGTSGPDLRSSHAHSLFDTGASVESLAHLAHEVRTPLTAIMGFAQMIEAETLGEASPAYCDRASAIVESATRLMDAVDDIADAAQLEQGRYAVVDGQSDLRPLLESIVASFGAVGARNAVALSLAISGPLPAVAIDERLLSRALDRLLSALLAAASNEILTVGARPSKDFAEILLARPLALTGLSAAQILDPAQPIRLTGASSALLGVGFGLRLAARLIEASGGRFTIEPEIIRILLPGIAKRDQIA